MKLLTKTFKDCNLCYSANDRDLYRFKIKGNRYIAIDVYDIGDNMVMIEGSCDRKRVAFDIRKINTKKGKDELKSLVIDFMANYR
jgi:hypothetical protein